MRKYWISGFMNKSRKIYDDLEMAIRACENIINELNIKDML